ncbi:unnamed protein product [Amoebophrya sp. A25]|nr:unnamed protein product [Amoebophrya sp. A25]|eukprot:GSA25T00026179001.1
MNRASSASELSVFYISTTRGLFVSSLFNRMLAKEMFSPTSLLRSLIVNSAAFAAAASQPPNLRSLSTITPYINPQRSYNLQELVPTLPSGFTPLSYQFISALPTPVEGASSLVVRHADGGTPTSRSQGFLQPHATSLFAAAGAVAASMVAKPRTTVKNRNGSVGRLVRGASTHDHAPTGAARGSPYRTTRIITRAAEEQKQSQKINFLYGDERAQHLLHVVAADTGRSLVIMEYDPSSSTVADVKQTVLASVSAGEALYSTSDAKTPEREGQPRKITQLSVLLLPDREEDEDSEITFESMFSRIPTILGPDSGKIADFVASSDNGDKKKYGACAGDGSRSANDKGAGLVAEDKVEDPEQDVEQTPPKKLKNFNMPKIKAVFIREYLPDSGDDEAVVAAEKAARRSVKEERTQEDALLYSLSLLPSRTLSTLHAKTSVHTSVGKLESFSTNFLGFSTYFYQKAFGDTPLPKRYEFPRQTEQPFIESTLWLPAPGESAQDLLFVEEYNDLTLLDLEAFDELVNLADRSLTRLEDLRKARLKSNQKQQISDDDLVGLLRAAQALVRHGDGEDEVQNEDEEDLDRISSQVEPAGLEGNSRSKVKVSAIGSGGNKQPLTSSQLLNNFLPLLQVDLEELRDMVLQADESEETEREVKRLEGELYKDPVVWSRCTLRLHYLAAKLMAEPSPLTQKTKDLVKITLTFTGQSAGGDAQAGATEEAQREELLPRKDEDERVLGGSSKEEDEKTEESATATRSLKITFAAHPDFYGWGSPWRWLTYPLSLIRKGSQRQLELTPTIFEYESKRSSIFGELIQHEEAESRLVKKRERFYEG